MTSTVAASPLPATDDVAVTIGVEEEFLLLDPATGVNRPVVEQAVAGLPAGLRDHSRLELRRSILEMVTDPCTGLAELRAELVRLRRTAADAAAGAGAMLVGVAATPVAEPDPQTPPKPRYRTMTDRFGPVAMDPAVCGMHVHVGVPGRDLAVQVCNHLQPWLPVIRALAGNSPIFEGVDTGHASWRSVQLERWPGVTPTPYFHDAADYDATVADLLACGVLLDASMVYWYARLSATHPTVEIRVADVCTDVDDTVLLAALTRAAVATAVTDIRAGRPAPQVRDCVVAAAHWRAARDGLTGELLDLRLLRLRPAWELVYECFACLSPALLMSGDLDLVVDGLARLRETGGGATRQREVFQRAGDLPGGLAVLAERTVAG